MQEDFIARKYKELKESKGILVIKRRDYERFDINEFNVRYLDARAYYCDYEGEKIIFLKRKERLKLDIGALIKQAQKVYETHDTENARMLYNQLLMATSPKDFIFARLGLLYLSQGNLNKALIYLKIATSLSLRTRKCNFDFRILINKILKNVDSDFEKQNEDEKPFVMMELGDFVSNLNDYYGTSKVREVSILMEYQGMSIDEASEVLNISEDDKNMITLLLARDCYARGDMAIGDEFLLMGERAKNKSLRVRKLLEEIKLNKRFYRNRVDENYEPLLRSRFLH